MGDGRGDRRWTRIFRPDPRAEVEEELAFHLEQRVNEYVARGMDAEEARAAALARLGGLDAVRNECAELLTAERRTEARRDWLRLSWLDFKLGFRLLLRYPGLTLVGGVAIAFGIAVGAGAFEFLKQMVDPTLPLEDGDRIVAVRNLDAASGGVRGAMPHDFVTWREELEGVEGVGAYRTIERNLLLGEGAPEPVQLAEISASGFGVARVSPLHGRTLTEADELPGAPHVLVLGYDVWQTRFAADPDVVGRVVRLGSTPTEIVGVMPEGFAFPVAHGLWVPLRLDAAAEPGAGEPVAVFGRLAGDVALAQAQAELTALGAHTAASFPLTHEHLRPEVIPFGQSFVQLDVPREYRVLYYAINVVFVLLLLLICANVALLMFARATTRESEIVVRTALGASRGRIVTQLFAEALVLAAGAAVVGLFAARFALRAWLRVLEQEAGGAIPFWFSADLGLATVLYTLLLALLAAVIPGVLPALKMTGRAVDGRLRRLAAGGGGARFGRMWTVVIVAQVAVTVVFPATAYIAQRYVVSVRSLEGVGFPAEQYLSARLELDAQEAVGAMDARSATLDELERRLEAEPGVAGVTFADRVPRTYHPAADIEIEGEATFAEGGGRNVSTASVATDFFDVLGAGAVSGRTFHAGDPGGAGVVVVNRSFVERILEGRNPIGRRVRYAVRPGAPPRPWHEIVGVVDDLGMVDDLTGGAGLYHPITPPAGERLHLVVHVRGEPGSFATRLREIAAGVDPTLRLHEVLPVDQVGSALWLESQFLVRLLTGVSAVALLLSLAGIYSVMSFTVSRRTREIGIRVALGSDPRHIATAIFRQPLRQVGTGVVLGGALVAVLSATVLADLSGMLEYSDTRRLLDGVLVVAYAALMMVICLLACVGPTRRALRIQPTEALRSDG